MSRPRASIEVGDEIKPLDLPDPVFMLSLYNSDIREGRVRLHDWQIDLQLRYAAERSGDEIIRIALCANNGSGKSQFGIAPAAMWLAMSQPYGRVVITSASGGQIDRQTGSAINHIAEQVNKLHGPWWKMNYRFLTFLPTKSTIEMYATDEAGKAEGYHPHVPDGEFSIMVDEGKSVGEDIYGALMRCNGLTRRLDVSSPGRPAGHFYNVVVGGRWQVMRVKAADCPHLNPDEIREAREMYGENSALFRSMYLAEFTSTDEQVTCSYESIAAQLRNPPASNKFGKPYAGLDLAAGGDENVLSVWHGNTQVGMEAFRFTDTSATVEHLVNLFKKYGLSGDSINADDGGVGRAIIDRLRDAGYACRRILNQSKPINSIAYGNRGAELYFNFNHHLPHLVLLPDATQKNQLASRYYRQSPQGKMLLESKREARAKGHGSPDRADAAVLAFAGKHATFFRDMLEGKPLSEELSQRPERPYEEMVKAMDDERYKGMAGAVFKEPLENVLGRGAQKLLTPSGSQSALLAAGWDKYTAGSDKDYINHLLGKKN